MEEITLQDTSYTMESMGHDYENTGAHSLKEENGKIAEQGPMRMAHSVGASMLIYVNFTPTAFNKRHNEKQSPI